MTPLLCCVCCLSVSRLVSIVVLLMLLHFPVNPSSAALSSRHSSYAVISTKLGQVRGRVVQATGNETCQPEEKEDFSVTTQFLGVPYALPPVGPLRFQESRKNNGWILQGVLDATAPRQRCPVEVEKHHMPTDTYDEGQGEGNREDCLYMNIYVPGNLSSTGYVDAMELPVLVIFSEEEQDSAPLEHALSRLACYGHIIVIDLSYRLGVLSYLSISGEKLTFGNNGFQDQRLAMLWIWDNVREFGGNPEKITVFAEREAAVSLGYHVLQPDSRGLFTRAVMHSGTPIGREYFERDYSAVTSAVANAVGCDNSMSVDVECLRSVALHELLKASRAVELNHTSWRRHMTDRQLVPSQVLESLKDGRFGQVDILIGSSEHDGRCLVRETDEPEILNKILKASLGTFIEDTMKGRYRNASRSEHTLQTIVDAVLFEYSSSCNVKRNVTETAAQLLTDMMFRAPAELTARLMSRDDNNVYLYLISSKNCSCSSLISLVQFTECMQKPVNQLERNVIDVLLNFVRNGNPNPLNGMKNWRPFTERERHFLHFTDEEMRLRQSLRQRKMTFWNDYFPYLLDPDSDSCRPQDVLPNATTDDETGEETIATPLVLCFVVAIVVVLVLFLIFVLMRLYRPHPLISGHRNCLRCCKTGQRQNRHDLMSAAVSDNDDLKLHPLPYGDESAWN